MLAKAGQRDRANVEKHLAALDAEPGSPHAVLWRRLTRALATLAPLVNEDPPIEPLTGRELDVLALMAEGLSNKAIASRLGISDQTVKFHVASICGKLGAVNRTDAVRRAIRRGLVSV